MKWKFWQRKPKTPNPGSREAALAGCICPVGINNAGAQKPEEGWCVRSGCELHGDMETRKTKDNGGEGMLYR